jgi:[1-hydroxy-2-(trimethylamino)ethyl]phosphonate dioxygenase
VGVYDEIVALFAARGSIAYFGEAVTTTQHALQAAHFARQEAAPPALILAALLHDIGHLIEEVPNDLSTWTHDACHEEVGARWLAQRFLREVSEPVRLHVPAKRYLCAVETAYLAKLSGASLITLKLQGGPMTAQERARFDKQPFSREAIRVRRWDDQGKIAALVTPELAQYRALLQEAASAKTCFGG